ncbi:MAG TPA: hypothetical protein VFI15_01325 [Candidatus Limnocylindrales bacterium]|jgi:hypothetical protein|nr:hypothetical protein [Candidatus Limnocylindrales bacterium]
MASTETHGSDPHAGESMVGPHGSSADHGEDHGHDDHAHGGDALGPINVAAWGAAALGIVLGLIVVLAFVQATS